MSCPCFAGARHLETQTQDLLVAWEDQLMTIGLLYWHLIACGPSWMHQGTPRFHHRHTMELGEMKHLKPWQQSWKFTLLIGPWGGTWLYLRRLSHFGADGMEQCQGVEEHLSGPLQQMQGHRLGVDEDAVHLKQLLNINIERHVPGHQYSNISGVPPMVDSPIRKKTKNIFSKSRSQLELQLWSSSSPWTLGRWPAVLCDHPTRWRQTTNAWWRRDLSSTDFPGDPTALSCQGYPAPKNDVFLAAYRHYRSICGNELKQEPTLH